MENIDWNDIWMRAMENASWRRKRGDATEFWDKRAKQYNELMKQNDRIAQMISKLDVDPECTVLDIGAGPGTLAIPLAKMVKHVTAVEPSTEMLSCLKKNASEMGITNIRYINKRWEDVKPEDVGEHDVLIASYSLAMLDMKAALLKMNKFAKEYVYLLTLARCSMEDYKKLWPELYGEEYKAGPDYIILYNILYDIGIYANVTWIEHQERFSSFKEAEVKWKENMCVSFSEGEKIIRSYLLETLIEDDGVFLSKNKMKSALIWWPKT